eukprot:g5892.t1 g5892   contig20:382466-383046(+)
MTAQHQVNAVERDGFRRMSGEDEMMFTSPHPFQDNANTTAATPTKASPPTSPEKGSKEILRPISMPKPFKI